MIKGHVLLLFLLALHLVELPILHATEVMWDYSKDIIYYEGKLYYPDQNGNEEKNASKISNEIPGREKNETAKEENPKKGEHEEKEEGEKLATGGQFWFCIFMIFSIFYFH